MSASGAGPPCPVNKQILRWSCFHFGLHLVHVEWRRLQVRVLPALSTNRYYDGAVFTLVFTLSMSNDAGFRCGSSLPCQQTDITMENWADHSLHLVRVEWHRLHVWVLPALSTTDITMENWADPCCTTDITMELFSLWSSPCSCGMTPASGAGPPCPVNNRYHHGELSWSWTAPCPCRTTDITMELFSLWSAACPCQTTSALSSPHSPCLFNSGLTLPAMLASCDTHSS